MEEKKTTLPGRFVSEEEFEQFVIENKIEKKYIVSVDLPVPPQDPHHDKTKKPKPKVCKKWKIVCVGNGRQVVCTAKCVEK